MKNLLIAVLVAVNLFLGLGLFLLVSEPPAARAQAVAGPTEYLLVPVQNNANSSFLVVIDAKDRKAMMLEVRTNSVTVHSQPEFQKAWD
jgi:hypothetical protein